MHLNINSLLPKIDEIRHMARLGNAALIGICESKLNKSIMIYYVVTGIEPEVGLPAILETTRAIHKRIYF